MIYIYNDTIKVANKIITSDDLSDIFAKMQEKLSYYKNINDIETEKNKILEYKYQKWTFKDSNSSLHFQVDFYDDTNIRFDNYNSFISMFNNRLGEIKIIHVYFKLYYEIGEEGRQREFYSQYINMDIYEHKMNIDVSLSSEDKKIDDVYELIKTKVLSAPEKYDDVIRGKNKISTIVGLAIGFIPALIIPTILIVSEEIRDIYATGYVVYPLAVLVLAFLIGKTVGAFLLDGLYKNIVPDKKYAGYDSYSYRSIYKDDIDKFVETSEILIGKNVNNLECREQIRKYKVKFKKWIPFELGIMAIISIIVLFLGSVE